MTRATITLALFVVLAPACAKTSATDGAVRDDGARGLDAADGATAGTEVRDAQPEPGRESVPDAAADPPPDGAPDLGRQTGPETGDRPDRGPDALPPDTSPPSVCGNGQVEGTEACDCGTDARNLPPGCTAPNGIFRGDGKGCGVTCTREPSCRDSSGQTRACEAVCGDGIVAATEECDDGNLRDGDGCGSTCARELGFACTTEPVPPAPCQAGSGECLQLPVVYRDFLPENVAGGHPDFYWPGTKNSSGTITTWCVPDTAGPTRRSDAMPRCWGIVADDLVDGKPQPGPTKTCTCQFTDWSVGISVEHIGGRYDKSDSPLASGTGYRSDVTLYEYDDKSIPTWKGVVPAYKDAASLQQWWNDDTKVNQTFYSQLELATVGSGLFRLASKVHKLDGGFAPLDALNPAQKTLCNMLPYWNQKFFPTCSGDQYLLPPRVQTADCLPGDDPQDGCWVNTTGQLHDFYFTYEARTYFAYDGTTGLTVQAESTDDLYVFINGKLVLDLGGTHQSYPGKVIIAGSPATAAITEGGCLDDSGNIIGAEEGSPMCSPACCSVVDAKSPDDFRLRKLSLGLETGKVYELAIFGANRHPPEAIFDLQLSGLGLRRTVCTPSR